MADREATVRDNPNVSYEREDWRLAFVALAAIVALAYLVLTPLILRGAYPDAASDVSRKQTVIPPAPLLQTDPQDDLRRFRAEEEARLNGYGWVDRAHDIAHVPIGEAMKRVAAQGIDGFPKGSP
jgi:hypothetical protein